MRSTSLLSVLGIALAVGCNGYSTSENSQNAKGQPAYAQVDPQTAAAARGRVGFGFNGSVSGFPTGTVRLTGGGSYDPAGASNVIPTDTPVASGGGFDCTDAVGQGPLKDCATGQGVRWDTAQLLDSIGFKCTATDGVKPAVTDNHLVALLADFYRAGDGNEESFTAQMIVADRDLAPLIPGTQNLWVQGVGCGTAIVNFNQN